jgi:hypothetical protein
LRVVIVAQQQRVTTRQPTTRDFTDPMMGIPRSVEASSMRDGMSRFRRRYDPEFRDWSYSRTGKPCHE